MPVFPSPPVVGNMTDANGSWACRMPKPKAKKYIVADKKCILMQDLDLRGGVLAKMITSRQLGSE